MSRFTLFVDIAGQVSFDTAGSDRITTAAVAVPTSEVTALRSRIDGKPKWRDSTEAIAEIIVEELTKQASAIAIVSITKEPRAWESFWKAAKPLHDAIVRQDNVPAGFIKPANVVRYDILGQSLAIALAHAIKTTNCSRITDSQSLELIERTIVCDTEIQGDENISVFKGFWEKSDQNQPSIKALGFRFITRDISITTEQQEPLLLLADFAAGIAHSALIPNPGRLPLPVANSPSKRLLGILNDSGKLVIVNKPFDLKYDDIFGEALEKIASVSP